MKSWIWVVIILIVVVIVGYFGRHHIKALLSGSSQSTPTAQTQTSTPTPSMSPEASASTSSSAQEFTVTGSEFKYDVSTINVKVGQPVTITFKNAGTFPHNLTIKDLNIATKTIQPGESDSITFTPSKTGSFEYMCTVDSHAEKGMTGTLVVQ